MTEGTGPALARQGRRYPGNDDAALYGRLVAADFNGPDFDAFADRAAGYAYPILQSWITSGRIAFQAERIRDAEGLLSFDGRRLTAVDVDDLVQETLILALRRFAEHARAGRGWSVELGASLTTYFLKGCVLAFSEVYQTWRRRQRRQHRAEAVAVTPANSLARDPADVVAAREELREHLPADARTRTVVLLAAFGYSHAEIAERLSDGASARAVEGLLYRSRRRLRRPDQSRR